MVPVSVWLQGIIELPRTLCVPLGITAAPSQEKPMPKPAAIRPDIRILRIRSGEPSEGRARVLIDRLWPRGITKAALAADVWLRDLAPSSELRQWFNHAPARWDEFQARYRAELDRHPDAVAEGLAWCRKGPVSLLYDVHEGVPNHATVLRDYLDARLERDG